MATRRLPGIPLAALLLMGATTACDINFVDDDESSDGGGSTGGARGTEGGESGGDNDPTDPTDPSDASTEGGSTGSDDTTGGGSTTTGADGSTGMGVLCFDGDNEPNDVPSEAEPFVEEPAFDCTFESFFFGTLNEMGDADWFTTTTGDTVDGGCLHEANIDLPGARVCTFAECAIAQSPTVECLDSDFEISDEGLSGCCSNVGPALMFVECTEGSSEVIDLYVRVDQGLECEDYAGVFEQS